MFLLAALQSPPPPLILPLAMAVNPRGFYFHALDKKKMPVNKL